MTPPTEDELRAEFERQHSGRDLARHPRTRNYRSANIQALWRQHQRTARWLVEREFGYVSDSLTHLKESP